jgi:hypothetical protein
MEKTLEIHLTDQRDSIYEAILNADAPEPMTWTHKLLWEQARIHFARLVLEAANGNTGNTESQ